MAMMTMMTMMTRRRKAKTERKANIKTKPKATTIRKSIATDLDFQIIYLN